MGAGLVICKHHTFEPRKGGHAVGYCAEKLGNWVRKAELHQAQRDREIGGESQRDQHNVAAKGTSLSLEGPLFVEDLAERPADPVAYQIGEDHRKAEHVDACDDQPVTDCRIQKPGRAIAPKLTPQGA